MASELSRLIDDELEKVERQQGEIDGKRQRTSFQIKGAEKSAQPSWREWAWWTRLRLVLLACGGLILFFVLWLLLSNTGTPSSSATAFFGKSSGKGGEKTANVAPEESIAGLLAPSFGLNGSSEQKGIATEREGLLAHSPAPFGELSAPVGAPKAAVSDSPASAPRPEGGLKNGAPGASPEEMLTPEFAPIQEYFPVEAPSPALKVNGTVPPLEGGPVKIDLGRRLRAL